MANPTREHTDAFGALIYHYASVETGLKIALCGMLQADLDDVLIMSQPYGNRDLRLVVKAIAKQREWKNPKHLDELISIIGDLKPISPLRNHIAHSRWTNGSRPDSIRPRHVDIRNEKAQYYGDDDAEKDWTAADIWAGSNTLVQLNIRLIAWLENTGLRALIDAKMASASAAIAE